MPEPRLLKTIFTYPWALHNDGPERAPDAIQNDARLNGVSLAVAYHISTYFLPHNPRRKLCFGADGRLLFQPAARRLGVDGFTFYNFGLLRLEQLRWRGTACRHALD